MRKYIAEFIGTFVLVLFACGVAAVTGCNGEANASYILTALAFGGVIIAMAYSIGNISGCHINPAVFILTILAVTSKKENSSVAGLVIGGTLILIHLFGIYFTGTSVNPARSLGPALLLGGNALMEVWVFIFAPLLGGVLAALIWKGLFDAKSV